MKEQGLDATDIARQMNIGRSTVYVILQNPK
nr:helix-turn-helix domain-containing protein [Prosthecochloris sp. HL-130-GSB]